MDDFKGVLCNMAYSVESGQPFSLDIIWAPLPAWSLFESQTRTNPTFKHPWRIDIELRAEFHLSLLTVWTW
jgi:hypothetical protein